MADSVYLRGFVCTLKHTQNHKMSPSIFWGIVWPEDKLPWFTLCMSDLSLSAFNTLKYSQLFISVYFHPLNSRHHCSYKPSSLPSLFGDSYILTLSLIDLPAAGLVPGCCLEWMSEITCNTEQIKQPFALRWSQAWYSNQAANPNFLASAERKHCLLISVSFTLRTDKPSPFTALCLRIGDKSVNPH